MHKIKHFFQKVANIFKNFTLTTPVAIVLGAVLISASLLSLGNMGYQITVTKTVIKEDNPLTTILKAVGVNNKDFTKCVDSGERAQVVTDSINDGVKAGVNGTPSTFILRQENGVLYVVNNISGAQTKNFFEQSIEQAINLTDVSKLPKFTGRIIDQNDLQEMTKPTKVFVVEYSDAECPFCTRLYKDMKEVRAEYSGRISYVYRNFPLVQIHQHAQKEAEMISCVGKLGGAKAYYPFIDAIFDYKINNNAPYIPYTAGK